MIVQSGNITLPASGALAPYLRVALSAGKLVAASASDRGLGTLESRVLEADKPAAVVPWTGAGTRLMVAAGTIAQYAKVYPAAGGKISDEVNGAALGIAMRAASGDGSIIEVYTHNPDASRGPAEITDSVEIGDFTDNGDATGYVDLATQIPAGSIVLGWRIEVTTGFTGDTTATTQLGAAGNLNQFSGIADGSVLAAGNIGSQAPGSSDNAFVVAATTPRLTVTGGSDFGNIGAGEATVTIVYAKL